jgi:hypothetical protein
VLRWWDIAQQCFSDEYGSLQRGFLTSVFMPVVDLERVFHLEQMDDPGFALLTGDPDGCPTRQRVGAWRKHLRWNEVDRFCHRTSPWDLLRGQQALISFDEHSLPRWTKKFSIRKGYVTTRNKYMRCEKAFFGYDLKQRRFVTLKATPGNVELRDVSELLTRRVLRFGQPEFLHAVFDAGAGKSDADVRRLLTLAEQTPNLDITLRACRYPHRMELWKSLPADAFTATSCRVEQASPRELLDEFRQRQHHEQAYRVEVHDANIDAARCGYDKDSPDRKRPGFCRGPFQMTTWLAALVYNACADLAAELGQAWEHVFIRTLRRYFFHRPGDIYLTPTSVIVQFERELSYQADLLPVIDRINAEQHRIPWMDNRLLVLSVCPDRHPRDGP